MSAEEFVDYIPYPETRLYVMTILAAQEQYRRIYSLPHSGALTLVAQQGAPPELASVNAPEPAFRVPPPPLPTQVVRTKARGKTVRTAVPRKAAATGTVQKTPTRKRTPTSRKARSVRRTRRSG
jgi:hypothetical protein